MTIISASKNEDTDERTLATELGDSQFEMIRSVDSYSIRTRKSG